MLLGPLCCSEVPGIYLLDLTMAYMGWCKKTGEMRNEVLIIGLGQQTR